MAASRRGIPGLAIWPVLHLASEHTIGNRQQSPGSQSSERCHWGGGRRGRRSRASGSEEGKRSSSRSRLVSAGRALDGRASGGSTRSRSGDDLSPDRGLLHWLLLAVSHRLQCLRSQVLLCPLEFVAEVPGSLSDGRLLLELLVWQSSLQSL